MVFTAGDAIQIDWGEAVIYLQGIRQTVYLFCARLRYSRTPLLFAYRRQDSESFLDALVESFVYFGGIPRRSDVDSVTGKVQVLFRQSA